MITYDRLSIASVRFINLSDGHPPAWWAMILARVGGMWQKRISQRYMREESPTTVGWKKLKPNSRKWNLYKAKKGYSRLRGHMLNRIQAALMNGRLFYVSAVAGGSAIVGLDEEALRQIVPHARHYAKMKAALRRLLAVNIPMIREALIFLEAENAKAWRKKAQRRRDVAQEERLAVRGTKILDIGRDTVSRPASPFADRKPWTLAQTATTATRLAIAALRRI